MGSSSIPMLSYLSLVCSTEISVVGVPFHRSLLLLTLVRIPTKRPFCNQPTYDNERKGGEGVYPRGTEK